MRLIASGRDADVFALSASRVLRRYRDPAKSAAHEAEVMRYAAGCGLPVPHVHDVSGPDLVMEHLHGLTMASSVTRQPWRLRHEAHRLAELHRRVHAVKAPAWLAPVAPGTALLHLDLHPGNVLLTPTGPRIIDWANAAGGPPGLDVADVWLLMSTAVLPGRFAQRMLAGWLARAFAREFAGAAGIDHREHVQAAIRRRLSDKNIGSVERARMMDLARALND